MDLNNTAGALPAEDHEGLLAVAPSTEFSIDLTDTAASLPAEDPWGSWRLRLRMRFRSDSRTRRLRFQPRILTGSWWLRQGLLSIDLKDTAAALPAEDPENLLAVEPSTALLRSLRDTAAALPAEDLAVAP